MKHPKQDHARIVALGSAFPTNKILSSDLEDSIGLPKNWIVERSGVVERRSLPAQQQNSDIAAEAAKVALDKACLNATELDLILGCTNSPDSWMPGLAPIIQSKIGAPIGSLAFDIVSACSSWMAGLQVAEAFIQTGRYKNILVVGSEGFTRFLDWMDANTGILFGDGAGACIVSSPTHPNNGGKIIAIKMHTDGCNADILTINSLEIDKPRGTKINAPQKELKLTMDRELVFFYAVKNMASVCQSILADNRLSISDIDWLVPHQANIWIIDAVGDKLGIPHEKVAKNIAHYGNTIAATLPTLFHQYVEAGKIKRGQLVLLTTFGAGMTWGATLVEW